MLTDKSLILIFGESASPVDHYIQDNFPDALSEREVLEKRLKSTDSLVNPVFKEDAKSVAEDVDAGVDYFLGLPCDGYYDTMGVHNLIYYSSALSIKDTMYVKFPENSLSAKYQLMMGDILIKAINADKHFVVQTNSEHILNRVIRRALEQTELIDKISVIYVNKDKSVTNSYIDEKKGIVFDTPCLEEFADETIAIIRQGCKNYRSKRETNNGNS